MGRIRSAALVTAGTGLALALVLLGTGPAAAAPVEPPPTSTAPTTSDPSAEPAYSPPTIRACAPCAVRVPPGPARLDTVGDPMTVPGGGDVVRPRTRPRPAADRALTSRQTSSDRRSTTPAFTLPETGAPSATLLAAGATLVAAGLVAVLAARRRSTPTTPATPI